MTIAEWSIFGAVLLFLMTIAPVKVFGRRTFDNANHVLAIAFLVVRIAFVLAYLGNLSTARSLLWNVAFLVNLAIFFLPAYGHLILN